MSQQVQELIDKIKSEGIEAANDKAKEIEADAQKRAEGIVAKAKKEAEHIVEEADKNAKLTQEKTKSALRQTARDMILNLKKEILIILNSVIAHDLKGALTPEDLAGIIEKITKGFLDRKSSKDRVVVTLSGHDLEKLKRGFVTKLQGKIKEGIEFRPTEHIDKGFMISFDGGKSSFDFTDESLAEYLSAYLSPEIAALLEKRKKT